MSLWKRERSGWVNLSLTIFLLVAVITSICSTAFRSRFKAVGPNFSYHTGLYPEVGLFHFLLFCSAICGFISVVLRYSYIMDQIQVMPASINYINKIAAAAGLISFLGLIVIASFSTSLMEEARLFQPSGAYIFIGLGVIFSILQTVLTFKSSRYSLLFLIRIFLTTMLMSTFIASIVFIENSKTEPISQTNNSIHTDISTLFFVEITETEISADKKQQNLLVACILEWISVTVYALFFLSFFQEFQTISAYIIMRPFISSPSNDFRSSSLTVNERV